MPSGCCGLRRPSARRLECALRKSSSPSKPCVEVTRRPGSTASWLRCKEAYQQRDQAREEAGLHHQHCLQVVTENKKLMDSVAALETANERLAQQLPGFGRGAAASCHSCHVQKCSLLRLSKLSSQLSELLDAERLAGKYM